MKLPREGAGRLGGLALWGLLALALVAWALLVWHPWIDWFGRT